MKQKWLGLTIPQRVIFCLQVILIVLFLILYNTVGKQQVLRYHDAALRRTLEGDTVTYAGKVEGNSVSFSVSGNTVEYLHEETVVIYTITEDPSAIPAREDFEFNSDVMYAKLSGVEIHKDGKLLFRGGWMPLSSTVTLYAEDGSNFGSSFFQGSSLIYSGDGTPPVLSDPGASTILRLVYAPDVVQRANFLGLVGGIFLCVVCMVTLLFVDELFRWNLRFSIRNVEDAEPSEWELCSRWMGWLTFTCLAVIVFIMGLTGR